jgi:hypothetical protein
MLEYSVYIRLLVLTEVCLEQINLEGNSLERAGLCALQDGKVFSSDLQPKPLELNLSGNGILGDGRRDVVDQIVEAGTWRLIENRPGQHECLILERRQD